MRDLIVFVAGLVVAVMVPKVYNAVAKVIAWVKSKIVKKV